MLHQIDPSEKVINEITKLFKTLKINQLLRAANIKKSRGIGIGLHIIGMVKSNYRYRYNGQLMKLDEIRKYLRSGNKSDIIGSSL